MYQFCESDSIKRLVARMDRLPTIPVLDSEMVRQLQSADASFDALAAVVEKDPGLTAKLLQLINSAFFGLSRPMETPMEAVRCLNVCLPEPITADVSARLNEIQPRYLLLEDITTNDGLQIVKANTPISYPLLDRPSNFDATNGVTGPILVWIPTRTLSPAR